ncbi:Spo0E family sporulation regulatory protein-aspartic acid phosphatase [Wukongibacter baidiensis]|uniref:Spo0E family sporulation regulatory protein-aspartic acid phosphatase n=1 Tax=Wukongibacter baidiensis TaxID=1723361 RepID=UPI003D7F69B9
MNNSHKLQKLISQIDETKINLYKLVEDKQWNLLDGEVIKLSQLLDELLLEYHHIEK